MILFKLVRDDPLKYFEHVRGVAKEYVKNVRSVRIHGKFLDLETFKLVVKYLIKWEAEIVSAKSYTQGTLFQPC